MFNEQEQFSASLCLPDHSIAFINDDMRVKYDRLNEGLRDKKDPVTWRTTVITLGELIGVQDPENNPASPLLFERGYAITKKLVEGTWQEPLLPEMLLALGFEQARDLPAEKLDVLLINARHNPEELLWTTAEELNNQGLNVAVMNPVGHYNDQETRIVGIGELLRDVENVIIMASTQTQKGGDWLVLNKTARLVRNSQFAKRIQRVFIDIPMWGGSRGHKTGQRKSLGYEVLEASANSKDLVLNLKDIWTNLYQESGYCPQLYVRTVDLHNVSSVKKIMHKFEKIEFHNLIPAPVLSGTIHREIENRNLTPYVRKYIASDAGAIERTETIAMEDIKSVAPGEFIDIVYISKKRQSAGVVGDAKVTKVIRWIKNADGTVIKKKLKPNADELDDCVIIQIDDMLDTGGTICKDGKLLDKRYPHKQQRWFVGTHPVLSKGSKVLADTGVNLFIFGNTLHYENGIPGSEPLKVDLSEVLALPILRLISNGHMI